MPRKDVDPERVQEVTADVKVQSKRAMPWDRLDPKAPPDKSFRVETNAYDREVFAFLALMRGVSVGELVRKFARDAANRELGKVPELREAG